MSKLTDKLDALHNDIRVFVKNAGLDIALYDILDDVRDLERAANERAKLVEMARALWEAQSAQVAELRVALREADAAADAAEHALVKGQHT